MRIGGFLEQSFCDYPGKRSAVIFTAGCNFRCHYCHNPSLVLPQLFGPSKSFVEIMDFLSSRVGWLEGVVVSGGEPTVQPDLLDRLSDLKSLGLCVKLDTNGTNPSVVKEAVQRGVVDYVAMDLKAPFDLDRMREVVGDHFSSEMLDLMLQTRDYLLDAPIDCEFRTTAISGVHSSDDLLQIGSSAGSRPYYLQHFRPLVTLDSSWSTKSALSIEEMSRVASLLGASVR